jgi:hypothetical protein
VYHPTLTGFPVVLLNGPPRSGKDTAARIIIKDMPGTVRHGFADPLKNATHALYCRACASDAYEDVKDTPHADFLGLSPRQAYIEMSERMVKPVRGKAFFGSVMVRQVERARAAGARMVVIPDSGFASELAPIIAAVGPASVLLLRMHRPGATFAGDSRSYVEAPAGVRSFEIFNAAGIDSLAFEIHSRVRVWRHHLPIKSTTT